MFSTLDYVVSLPSDIALASSTTLQDVFGLEAKLAASSKYTYRFSIPFNEVLDAAGIKLSIVAPASPAVHFYSSRCYKNGASQEYAGGSVNADLSVGIDADGDHFAEVEGYIETNEKGLLKIQFAQKVSDTNALTIKAGSFLRVCRLFQLATESS
jgi:hypothetical protein